MLVLERLWKAAYVFHREGSLEANLWVLDRTCESWFGEVGQVVKGIRQSFTKRGLSGPKRKTLNGVAKLPLSQPHPNAVSRIPGQRWADCQWPSRGACKNLIQRSNGTLRHALWAGSSFPRF
jgi:hypothetical protein